MSGDAFRITQSCPLADTATDDCVLAGITPARAALQFTQPQFHCGSPPPAAAPKIKMCKGSTGLSQIRLDRFVAAAAVVIFCRLVHVDFHAACNVFYLWCCPSHVGLPDEIKVKPLQTDGKICSLQEFQVCKGKRMLVRDSRGQSLGMSEAACSEPGTPANPNQIKCFLAQLSKDAVRSSPRTKPLGT